MTAAPTKRQRKAAKSLIPHPQPHPGKPHKWFRIPRVVLRDKLQQPFELCSCGRVRGVKRTKVAVRP